MSEEIIAEDAVKAKMDVFEGMDPEVKIRTKKMMMWFIIFAVVMLFAGVTSAIIVLNGKLMWLHVVPPASLWISNALIVLSSITLIAAVRFLKSGKQQLALAFTAITLLLGIAFTVSQNAAWKEMSARGMGYTVTANEDGLPAYRWNTLGKVVGEYGKDYWYTIGNERVVKEGEEYYKPSDPSKAVTNTVMTTFNASGAMISILIYVHIIHLLFGLIYLAINTVRIARGKLNADNSISLYTNGMYWHFLGMLWLYLFAFVFYIF